MSEISNKPDLSALQIERSKRGGEDDASPLSWRPIALAFAALGLVLVFYSWWRVFWQSLPEVEAVTVVAIKQLQAEIVLNATGYVVAQRQAAVASKGTGRLEYLGVEAGDRVQKDQIIARLENDDVEAALAQARANLLVAEAALETAQAAQREAELAFRRQQALLADSLISLAEFEIAEARYSRAKAAVASARAGIKAAEAAVRAAEVAVENTNIRAPFDGTVLTKNADVGEVVAPFGSASNARAAVVTIADMNSLELEADVSEANIDRIRIGQPCEIVLDAYPQIRYRGLVKKIVPTADRAKATVLTKVQFVDIDARVLPEMSAKVAFLGNAPASPSDGALLIAIPPTCIVQRDGQKRVFVINEDGLLQEREIETGGMVENKVEVRHGLQAGEHVVRIARPELSGGQKVKVKTGAM